MYHISSLHPRLFRVLASRRHTVLSRPPAFSSDIIGLLDANLLPFSSYLGKSFRRFMAGFATPWPWPPTHGQAGPAFLKGISRKSLVLKSLSLPKNFL